MRFLEIVCPRGDWSLGEEEGSDDQTPRKGETSGDPKPWPVSASDVLFSLLAGYNRPLRHADRGAIEFTLIHFDSCRFVSESVIFQNLRVSTSLLTCFG